MAQLHKDPTLDHHWDLWKKTYGKEYKDKVEDIATWVIRFYSSTLCFLPLKLYSYKLCFQ